MQCLTAHFAFKMHFGKAHTIVGHQLPFLSYLHGLLKADGSNHIKKQNACANANNTLELQNDSSSRTHISYRYSKRDIYAVDKNLHESDRIEPTPESYKDFEYSCMIHSKTEAISGYLRTERLTDELLSQYPNVSRTFENTCRNATKLYNTGISQHLFVKDSTNDSNVFNNSTATQATIIETSLPNFECPDQYARANCYFIQQTQTGKIFFFFSRLKIKNLSLHSIYVAEIVVEKWFSKIKTIADNLHFSGLITKTDDLFMSFYSCEPILGFTMLKPIRGRGNEPIAYSPHHSVVVSQFSYLKPTECIKVALFGPNRSKLNTSYPNSNFNLINEDGSKFRSRHRMVEMYKNDKQPTKSECLVDVNIPSTLTSVISALTYKLDKSNALTGSIFTRLADKKLYNVERTLPIDGPDFKWNNDKTNPKKTEMEHYLIQNVERDAKLKGLRYESTDGKGLLRIEEDIPTRDDSGLGRSSVARENRDKSYVIQPVTGPSYGDFAATDLENASSSVDCISIDSGTHPMVHGSNLKESAGSKMMDSINHLTSVYDSLKLNTLKKPHTTAYNLETDERPKRIDQRVKCGQSQQKNSSRETCILEPRTLSNAKLEMKCTETESCDTSRESDDEDDDTSTYKQMTVRALLKKYERLTNELKKTNRTIELLVSKSRGFKLVQGDANHVDQSNIIKGEVRAREKDDVDKKSSQSSTMSHVSQQVDRHKKEDIRAEVDTRTVSEQSKCKAVKHGSPLHANLQHFLTDSTMPNHPDPNSTTIPTDVSSTTCNGIIGNRHIATYEPSTLSNPYANCYNCIHPSVYKPVTYPSNDVSFLHNPPVGMAWCPAPQPSVVLSNSIPSMVPTELETRVHQSRSYGSPENPVFRVYPHSRSQSEHRVEKRHRHKTPNHRASNFQKHDHQSHRAKSQRVQRCETSHVHNCPYSTCAAVSCHGVHRCGYQFPGACIHCAHMLLPYGPCVATDCDPTMNCQCRFLPSYATQPYENWQQSHLPVKPVKPDQPHTPSNQLNHSPIGPLDNNAVYVGSMNSLNTNETCKLTDSNKGRKTPTNLNQDLHYRNTQPMMMSNIRALSDCWGPPNTKQYQMHEQNADSTALVPPQTLLSTSRQPTSQNTTNVKLLSDETSVPTAFKGRSLPRSPLPVQRVLDQENPSELLMKPTTQPIIPTPQGHHESIPQRKSIECQKTAEYPNRSLTDKNEHPQRENPMQLRYNDSVDMYQRNRIERPAPINGCFVSRNGSLPEKNGVLAANQSHHTQTQPITNTSSYSQNPQAVGLCASQSQQNSRTYMTTNQSQQYQSAQAVVASRANLPGEPSTPEEWKNVEHRYDQLQKQKVFLEGQLCRLPKKSSVEALSVNKEEERLINNLSQIDRELSALRFLMRKRFAQARLSTKGKS